MDAATAEADTGSLRADLLALTRTAIANATTPEVEAGIRAVAAVAPHAVIAAAAKEFWAERLVVDGKIVERAIARGEVAAGVEPGAVIEAVLGPPYMRLLVTGRPIDDKFIEATVDLVVGCVTVPVPRSGQPTVGPTAGETDLAPQRPSGGEFSRRNARRSYARAPWRHP